MYNMLMKEGLSEDNAKKRVRSLTEYERELFRKIREKQKLNENFKEEFQKLFQ